MVNKKRTAASRSKATSSPVVTRSGASVSDGLVLSPTEAEQNLNLDSSIVPLKPRTGKIESSLVESEASSHSAVKLDCEKALTALRRGNYTKSLRLMKDLCIRYENTSYSSLIYRVQGTICVKVASIIDDSNTKQRHLKNAIESARKAVALSQNSIEFSHFYANLLYEVANDGKEYEEVVQECERGLAIENPIDPAKESLQDESQHKQSTSESRISHVQSELRSLVQKSNIASISNWMKNLGNGEDKFRFIPIRRVSEDPMEVRLVPARRPNEIKKATKTPEERRKEIEVRVAAARLLQQKSESPQLQNDDNKGMDSSSGSNQRTGERRKSSIIRKGVSSSERKDGVRSYWNSMGLDMKKDLLKVTIPELKAFFSSSKDTSGCNIICEAIAYAEGSRTWSFWMCCRCTEKFSNPESHAQHVVQEHLGNLMPKMQSVIPANVDNEWIEMLLNCSWKPLDLNAAFTMVDNRSAEIIGESLPKIDTRGHKDSHVNDYCSDEAWISSPQRKINGDSYHGNIDDDDKIHDSSLCFRGNAGNQGFKSFPLSYNWPLSDDSERGKLLEKISSLFQVIIKHKCLAAGHLTKIMQFVVEELQSLASGSLLLAYGIDQTPNCMCFLGASELKKVFKFLQDLSHSCGIGRYPEKNNGVDDLSSCTQAAEILEKVTLSEDASCLQLYEHFLSFKGISTSSINGLSDNVVSPDSNWEDQVSLDDDALLSWIFLGPTSSEQLASWTQMKKDKVRQGTEIFETLEKEFYHLQSMCERKCEHLSYDEALLSVENHCLEEVKKREHDNEFVRRSYEYILRKRIDELNEFDSDSMSMSSRFEVDALSNILKEADNMHANQYGFEETYGTATSHLCDLESGEVDGWRTKDYSHQTDSCIEVAIQRQKDQVSTELNKLDAKILRTVNEMQQLEVKLEPASSHDYRTVLVPLVKSYLRAHLEDMAEKDATEKSDAAREAFLAELDKDSKRGSDVGGDNSKHHEKIKDKKKNKEHRKAKDTKVATSNEPILHPDAEEMVEDIGSEPDMINDLLKKEEEDSKRRIELEAEERKLEETLQYQRRIEEEAKQKHLARQHKNINKIVSGTLAGIDRMIDPLSHQDELIQENGISEDFIHISKNSVDRTLQRIAGTQSHLQSKAKQDMSVEMVVNNDSFLRPNTKQVLPNGEILEAGISHSDQRIGRRGRRHKNSAKLADTRPQELSSDKENIEVGLGRTADSRHSNGDISSMGDSGTKTLRQLKAEEDDEERFQADLKRAVRQSLDSSRMFRNSSSSKVEDMDVSSKGAISGDVVGADVYGTGLKNEVGEYNCFLNVIIQSLWHVRLFRNEFLRQSTSGHIHVGDPCVTCALYDIFLALSRASTEMKRDAIAPTTLRTSLSNLYPESNFFQEAQMNDASEVLGVIFNCLHQSFTPALSISNADSADRNGEGSWDCTNSACIAHSIFGMNIFERMYCYSCGLESRHMNYTSFFHNINASALRTMKMMCAESSFDELLNLVEMNHQLACDPEAGGCGKLNHIHHILSSSPHVFITVLGWQNTCEGVENIAATLSALATEMDVGIPYRGLDPKTKHCLVSVVCYYGQHYHCFAYSHEHEQWVMYDDKTVKVIGSWDDVLIMCEKGHLQPQVLFFEGVN